MAVFGPDYSTNVMEVFYIREKPVSPQPEDGVIMRPGHAHGKFEQAFKADITGHGITAIRTLRDLPGREVVSCQRRKVNKLCISCCMAPHHSQYPDTKLSERIPTPRWLCGSLTCMQVTYIAAADLIPSAVQI